MKKLFVIFAVAVVAFVALQELAKRKLGSENLSPDQQVAQSIETRIDNASQQIAQASRAAGVSGIDSTSDVEAALRDLDRVESDIQALEDKTDSAEIRKECARLKSKVEAVRR